MCSFFFWLLYPRIAVIIHVAVSNFFLWKRSEKREQNTKHFLQQCWLIYICNIPNNRCWNVLSPDLYRFFSVWSSSISVCLCKGAEQLWYFSPFYIIYAYFMFDLACQTRPKSQEGGKMKHFYSRMQMYIITTHNILIKIQPFLYQINT